MTSSSCKRRWGKFCAVKHLQKGDKNISQQTPGPWDQPHRMYTSLKNLSFYPHKFWPPVLLVALQHQRNCRSEHWGQRTPQARSMYGKQVRNWIHGEERGGRQHDAVLEAQARRPRHWNLLLYAYVGQLDSQKALPQLWNSLGTASATPITVTSKTTFPALNALKVPGPCQKIHRITVRLLDFFSLVTTVSRVHFAITFWMVGT